MPLRRRSAAPSLPRASRGPDWRSYDAVAETYARVRAPVHELPAVDLVAEVEPPPGGRVLDVGTGTGVAARAAVAALGPDGIVVGVDPSMGMLAQARGFGGAVAARAVDLPFRDGTFDVVMANFVIAFFTKYDTALFDMVRVLRAGGKLGVTAWAGRDDEFTRTWREMAEAFATKDMLRDAARKAVPWEERFSDPKHLEETLRDATLRSIRVHRRQYRSTTSIEDYLAGRETSALGRFLRDMLGATLWERFRERVSVEFRRRFSDPIGDTSDVLIAVGVKER